MQLPHEHDLLKEASTLDQQEPKIILLQEPMLFDHLILDLGLQRFPVQQILIEHPRQETMQNQTTCIAQVIVRKEEGS